MVLSLMYIFRFFMILASVEKAAVGLLIINDPSVPCIRLAWGAKKERIIPFVFSETNETASGFVIHPVLHQFGPPEETAFPTQEDIHQEVFALLRAVAYPDGQKTASELKSMLAKNTGWIPGDHLFPIVGRSSGRSGTTRQNLQSKVKVSSSFSLL